MNTEKQVKIGQEPAFGFGYEKLRSYDERYGTYKIPKKELGMSKRFYAACAAMQGLLSNHAYMDNLADKFEDAGIEVVKDAYEIADKLLKKENE